MCITVNADDKSWCRNDKERLSFQSYIKISFFLWELNFHLWTSTWECMSVIPTSGLPQNLFLWLIMGQVLTLGTSAIKMATPGQAKDHTVLLCGLSLGVASNRPGSIRKAPKTLSLICFHGVCQVLRGFLNHRLILEWCISHYCNLIVHFLGSCLHCCSS